MIEQANETKPLGLVWLFCPYPILARGLTEILGEEALVHHGEQLPKGADLSCVLFCVDRIENVPHKIKPLQAAVPDTPILVFGLTNGLPFARAALQAGARGFVHAGMPPGQVVRALTVASRGEIAVPRELLKDLVAGTPPVDLDSLTPRQREILKLVIEGQTNAQIGRELYLSESTIKQHLRAAYKILKVRNRTEASRLLRNEEL
jgi:two-component system nitrate/nitrite response regulator NarL